LIDIDLAKIIVETEKIWQYEANISFQDDALKMRLEDELHWQMQI